MAKVPNLGNVIIQMSNAPGHVGSADRTIGFARLFSATQEPKLPE